MLTLEETVKLILEHRSDLDRKKVMTLIAEKRQQMGPDLVNDESAAMIVARDLGIDLYQMSPRPRMKIEDINESTRNITITAKVVGIDGVREFSRQGGGTGRVASITIADDTGKIRVALWDEMTRAISDEAVTVGSWVQIRNAYVKRGLRGALELNLGRMGGLRVLDEHEVENLDIRVVVSDVTKIKDIEESMYDVAIKFKVVNVFGLRTFVKRNSEEGKVLSVIGADETGSTRVVFWDDFAEQMRDVKEGEIIRIKGAYTRKGRYGDIEVHSGRSSIIERHLQERVDAVEYHGPVFEEMGLQPISKLTIEMKDVDIEGKVLKIFPPTTFQRNDKEGQVQNILITDGSGTVRVTFWNEDVEKIQNLREGDGIRIRHGYIKEGFRGGVEFHVGRRAVIEINPEEFGLGDLDISQVPLTTTVSGERIPIGTIEESMVGKSVEISGLVMAVSQRNPVYPACPNCKKKLEIEGTTFRCLVCGEVSNPEYRLLFKVTLDDGSGAIPVTLFGQIGEELLGITTAEVQKIVQSSGNMLEPFNQVMHQILGCRISVGGRISKFRDSLEITASTLKFPDTLSEIERERERVESLLE